MTTNFEWLNGDFNYDGKVDDTDVTLLGGFYNESMSIDSSGGTNNMMNGGGEEEPQYDEQGYLVGSREDRLIQAFASKGPSAIAALIRGFPMYQGGDDSDLA